MRFQSLAQGSARFPFQPLEAFYSFEVAGVSSMSLQFNQVLKLLLAKLGLKTRAALITSFSSSAVNSFGIVILLFLGFAE